jgi:hypothetical protein
LNQAGIDHLVLPLRARNPASLEGLVSLEIVPAEKLSTSIFQVDDQFESAVGKNKLSLVIGE